LVIVRSNIKLLINYNQVLAKKPQQTSMKRTLLMTFFLVGALSNVQCQKKIDISSEILYEGVSRLPLDSLKVLDSLKIDFQLRGNCYAFSSGKYAKESNGEAHSSNIAKPNNNKFQTGLFGLYLSEKEYQKIYENGIGHTLYLLNTTNSTIEFPAQDSRLDIIAEIKKTGDKWMPITYLPSSWCGNSYHTIALGPNEYWEFVQPVFKGSFKTKLRYRLTLENSQLISNEIDVYVNPNQMKKEHQEVHRKRNLMDPYNE